MYIMYIVRYIHVNICIPFMLVLLSTSRGQESKYQYPSLWFFPIDFQGEYAHLVSSHHRWNRCTACKKNHFFFLGGGRRGV